MRVIPGNAQQVGDRHEQQDEFAFTNIEEATFVAHGGVLAVVADGIGGMAMGRQASQCVVQTILAAYGEKSRRESIPEALTRAFYCANGEILRLAEEAGMRGKVGTTAVAAVIHQRRLHWASVGDSRLYLYRQGALSQITTDHVYAAELARAVERGDLSQEEADQHPERYSLTSYLGVESLTKIDTSAAPVLLHSGDRVLLCSDGLYGTLAVTEMAAVLAGDPQRAAEALVRETLAKQKPRQDNVTAVVMAWEDEHWLRQSLWTRSMDTVRLYRYAILVLAFLFVGMIGLAVKSYWGEVGKQTTNEEDQSAFMPNPPPPSTQPSVGEEKWREEGREHGSFPLPHDQQNGTATPLIGQ
ncbi:MAG: PP2C family serine/threonine-protein phosphatase [Candidatus Binatia bacterium]